MPNTKPKIEVEGARELQRALNKMADHTEDLKAVHQRLAPALVAAAMQEVPTRTGALGASIRASASKRALGLRAGNRGTPYAGPIHYGWGARNISPNPFLNRARDAVAPEVAESYERQIEALIETLYRDTP